MNFVCVALAALFENQHKSADFSACELLTTMCSVRALALSGALGTD